ncbi:MAG: hypothetical protein CBB71_10560 [Rhodopirellula sp. TMED11]|nr:MAG: hypothetical protein CBB71_10560 [Rhodopirellula sp. TMED11]
MASFDHARFLTLSRFEAIGFGENWWRSTIERVIRPIELRQAVLLPDRLTFGRRLSFEGRPFKPRSGVKVSVSFFLPLGGGAAERVDAGVLEGNRLV